MTFLMSATFTPEDMEVLRGVLDNWCVENKIDIKSTAAQGAASAAIDLFQTGHNTSEKLLVALRQREAA
jgi:hypothetical protein